MREIIRDAEKNKLLIRDDVQEKGFSVKPDYREKMLVNNNIEGILNLNVYTTNTKKTYEYDTTGLSTLELIGMQQHLDKDKVRKLFIGIVEIVTRGERYLLEENEFILIPEYIFVDRDFNPYIAYCPGFDNNISKQFGKLAEYLMNQIDYRDKDAVLLTYTIYMKSREEGFSIEDVGMYLNENESYGGLSENDLKIKEIGITEPKENSLVSRERMFDYNKYIDGTETDLRFFENDSNFGKEEIKKTNRYTNKKISLQKADKNTYVKYILSGICPLALILLSIKLGILNSADGKIDMVKFSAAAVLGIGIFICFIKKIKLKDNDKKRILNSNDIPDEATELLTGGDERKEDVTELLYDSDLIRKEEIYSLESGEYPNILITHFPFSIGKNEDDVDFCLKFPGISRNHVRLEKIESGIGVRDLRSTNGSFINGVRIEPDVVKKICDGDELSIGACRYRLVKSPTNR